MKIIEEYCGIAVHDLRIVKRARDDPAKIKPYSRKG